MRPPVLGQRERMESLEESMRISKECLSILISLVLSRASGREIIRKLEISIPLVSRTNILPGEEFAREEYWVNKLHLTTNVSGDKSSLVHLRNFPIIDAYKS